MSSTHVQIEVWYTDEDFPNLKQCLLWMTVDSGPEYPRSKHFLNTVAGIEKNDIHEFIIREIDPPVTPTHEAPLAIH